MGSDKTKALMAFVKLLVSLAAGYGILTIWTETRAGLDEWYVPYGAGLIVAVMVFLLLSKLNKGSGD